MERKNWVGLTVVLGLLLSFTGAVPMESHTARAKESILPLNRTNESGGTALMEEAANPSPTSLLQFRARGHIVGFLPDRVYMATLDHALSVEFVGAEREMPPSVTDGAGPGTRPVTAPLTYVAYAGLWPGIDVTYEGRDGAIAKSTYQVAPGADVGQIRLRYNAPAAVQSDGSLRIEMPPGQGTMRESAPVAWQEIGGRRVPVEVSFRVSDENLIGFQVRTYDRRYPLTIDPTYEWHTFYGSNNYEEAYALALDGSGGIYVAGRSQGTWDGPEGQAPLHAHSGYGNWVVLKLDASGAYRWHTFYGEDSGTASAVALAVDGRGHVYIAGNSDGTWDGPEDQSPLHPYSGSIDLLVVKLNGSGAYLWHTFYGSEDNDSVRTLALDSTGGIYVAGYGFATWDGSGGQPPLHAFSGGDNSDLVVLQLNASGAYRWHTFYGSESEYDSVIATALAIDGSGNVYVAGDCGVSWDGPEGQAPLHAHSGSTDLLVLKLNGSGGYRWHTFFGSSSGDFGMALAVGDSEDVYLAGYSWATWDGPEGKIPVHAHSGGSNLVVLKLDDTGAYNWHTFYGSGNGDVPRALALYGSEDLYVTGRSDASWAGPGNEVPLDAHSGGSDLAVLKLDTAGVYHWHAFYGSGGSDTPRALALDSSGDVYVAGFSNWSWDGPGSEAPLHAFSGNNDLMVLKLALRPLHVDRDATGANDGTSWIDAYTELQTALAAAEPGNEIWVAEGVYHPDVGAGQTNDDRGSSFALATQVAVYGGFAGTETSRGQRDWSLHQTVLSGDIGMEENSSDNAFHVVSGSGVQPSGILDGFTISDGNAGDLDGDHGGGMYNDSGSPTLKNLTFTSNHAFLGGGIFNANSSPTLVNVTFSGNTASHAGGGMYNDDSHPTLTNLIFNGNMATDWGGGICNISSNATLANVVFSGNSASSGGGMDNSGSSPVLTNVTFGGNAADGGGGMHNRNNSSPVLINCILWDNIPDQTVNDGTSNPVITYSDVQGGWSGMGNMDANPRFVDADGADGTAGTPDDDLRLLRGSPIIDAGDSSAVPRGLRIDLDGRPRITNGAVDMGAYERPRRVYLPLVFRNSLTWDPYYEENDHWLAAYGPLAWDQAYQAYPDDADDYYYFQLSSAATVNIRVENFAPTSTHGDLLLYGPATGDDRGPRITYFGQPGYSSMLLDPQALEPGKYYLRVYVADSNYYSNSQLYTLVVSH